jgi:hypothetical protein
VIPMLPEEVIAELSQRRHRFHHYLWHRLRNSWSSLDENARDAIRQIDPAWVPPRPALDAMRRPIRDNDSGEDFLFVHRRMLRFVNAILAVANRPVYPRVDGWRCVPPPNDPDYPVPDFTDSGLDEIKSDEYFERFISPWEQQYTHRDYLRGVTLGQLGSDIEFTIYNDMHMRWAAPSPVGYRPTTFVTVSIDKQWDAPRYNYLGDTYSNRVNPLFWKLHGWVDNRIEDWKRACGVRGAIEWRGTWLGPIEHQRRAGFHETMLALSPEVKAAKVRDELTEVDRIISVSSTSQDDGFFRPSDHVYNLQHFRRRPLGVGNRGQQ